ncbi:MAG: glycosyltransferase family 2 protein [Nitrosomonas sp.]|nr:glycosyltransferase family 2 protein [Nitrosomonas sp.]
MQDRQSVSVIIINHNAGNILIQCVTNAMDQARQTIVIDNASSDNSLNNLKAAFPGNKNLIIHCADTNQGFAAGCNMGYKLAHEAYILFLNPDSILEKNTISTLIQALESNASIGMTGGQITNPDGTEQGGARRDIPTPWRAFIRATGLYRLEKFWPKTFPDFHLHKKPLPDKPIEVEATSGAMMLVRREALEAVGGWDEGYFLHCEDLDLCMRFRQNGWKILFVPDAKAVHYQGTCSKARPFFVAWHKHKGMVRFYRKFFGKQYSPILMGLVTCGVWLRFMLTVLFYTAQGIHKFLKPKHE